ncbi:transcriptional repressor LexA [Pseudobacteriovorax antillogorgiicola]|uniref:SOS-response transcriptional repressor, LexA n=1 Tax=Pseudobacteriovorax antillogorgiicola TaxID=1513793 RepID=A0A1Y6CT86_9BACT|nr:transcriptional repressor LexA [Pseudobacteriovorax antillogorgiicola]TCS45631.1 SOS-response transcriptional repressor LexA [Pseudobacteriovorax antillogorgiicola]SMF72518.1 SOS-response transcriptional repressor, LexA [Pseudobacteriovorax antillogorgiicola]
MDKLTSKQQKAFDFIRHHTESKGYSPSLRELCHFMGYKAVGSAQDVIASLRRKGYLELAAKQKARTLIITSQAKRKFTTTRVEEDFDTISIPQLGSVPAGLPVEAIPDAAGSLKVSPSLLPRPMPPRHKLFALQASGLSMIGAGILDGDWLIVKSQEEATPGSIVVALVDGDATVKRLMQDQDKGWYLKPENVDFKPIFASDNEFQVIGKVIGLQRTVF